MRNDWNVFCIEIYLIRSQLMSLNDCLSFFYRLKRPLFFLIEIVIRFSDRNEPDAGMVCVRE